MAEDITPRLSRCLWKHRAAIVAFTLCSMAGFVLLAVSELPWNVKRPMHVVDVDNRLIPIKDVEDLLPNTNASSLVRTKDLVEVKEFELKTHPSLIKDGEDLVVSWERNYATTLTNYDFVTLSCGPTTGEGDYLYKKEGTRVRPLGQIFVALHDALQLHGNLLQLREYIGRI
ncbi:unnamed protein product [Peronospora destructor]|uniref:Uncharacterized protein n=1 Tax=Peronospora destructor TaxID=86335 RepID=A0AAV0UJL3_9STRA|nr:unnamed protein product [Peronospora destructor]